MKRRSPVPSAAQVSQTVYESLRKEVLSGDLLFELHSEFPFTRPGLPARRWQGLDEAADIAPRGSAVRAAGNLAITAATLIDDAGRQQDVPPRMLKTIGSHMFALEILSDELDALSDDDQAPEISAAEMSQKIENQYADWVELPPEHVLTIAEDGEPFDITAGMAQDGLRLLQQKLINETG